MSGTDWRRRLLTLAALLGTAAGLWLFTAAPARAVDKIETGIWWRDQTGAATLPAPPQVPKGGLWVSSDPSGPSAISAIRFTLADSEGFPTLSLRVANLAAEPVTPATSGTVPMRACVAIDPWTTPATFPGKWSERPGYDCTKGSVPSQLAPDRKTVAFDLTVLPAAQAYSLVVVPSTAPDVVPVPLPPAPAPGISPPASSPTFDVSFEPPEARDLAVFPTSAPQPAAPSPAALPSVADGAAGPAPLASLDVPLAPVAIPPAPVTTAAAVPGQVGFPSPSRALVRPLAKVTTTSRATRITAGVVFCALAAWAWRVLAADRATGDGVRDRRPALTLYDSAPTAPASGLRPRFTTSPRTGAPPALR